MYITGIDKEVFIQRVKQDNKRIICFGATDIATVFFLGSDIVNYIDFFVDTYKNGTNIEILSNKFAVKSPKILLELDCKNYVILITAYYYSAGILSALEEMKITEKIDIYSWMDIDKHEKDFRKKNINPFLTHFMQSKKYNGDDDKLLSIYNDVTNKNKVVIPAFNYVLTSDCSLKCKYCSQYVPYLKTKYKAPYQQVVNDIGNFLECIDYCGGIGLIGGEPFLYEDLDKVIEAVLKFGKFYFLIIVTNGTIIPREKLLELLKNERVVVSISDYGHLTKKERLVSLFKEHGINFRLPSLIWSKIPLDNIHERKFLSDDSLKNRLLLCPNNLICKSMHNGKLYSCQVAFNIQYLPPKEVDYEKINQDFIMLNSDDSLEIRKSKMKKFICKDVVYTCDYCGFTENLEIVPPAEQLE